MIKKIGICAVLASGLLLNSCSEDFKTGADYKNIDIVYGLINVADTAQYIKITKGFFNETANNIELAKNPDSLYHSNLTVVLEEIVNNTVNATIPLIRVDLELEGYPKNPGSFATTPNYAYKTTQSLAGGKVYRLKITNPLTGAVITGQTQVLSNSISLTNIQLGNPLSFTDVSKKNTFRWSLPANTGLSELWMRINYFEDSAGVFRDKFVDLPLATRVAVPLSGNQSSVDFPNNAFIGLIRSGFKPAANDVKRYIDTCSMIVYAGGVELAKYIDVSNAQGGITADQIKPVYTNLKSSKKDIEDVYGLFDTRISKQINNIPLTKATIDSLVASPLLADIRIVGISPK
jgi:hypothetical protein